VNDVSPGEVVRQIARAVPEDCREHIVLVGSLAAAYQLLRSDSSFQVRTKDADCVISPRVTAVDQTRAIAERLLKTGWTTRGEGEFGQPGAAGTPTSELPLIRLYPPGLHTWFIEFLTVREPGNRSEWERVELSAGDFALRSFEYSGLLSFEASVIESGLRCATPPMMALANMLEHPRIRPEKMSAAIASRAIKRSNKDLGRVLILAQLAGPDAVESEWAESWERGLRACFPERWAELAASASKGIEALLASPPDLDEALHTCNNGLLANRNLTLEQLTIAGRRLLQDAITPLTDRVK
jgi:hypothetical protein